MGDGGERALELGEERANPVCGRAGSEPRVHVHLEAERLRDGLGRLSRAQERARDDVPRWRDVRSESRSEGLRLRPAAHGEGTCRVRLAGISVGVTNEEEEHARRG